ncbi:MAG: hypothetical protein ACI9GM_001614 [Salibacteraceae bacterium]|jgi:hypothetical protein
MRTIGRIDKAGFPELILDNIDVKIDTGAYTSSIHSHEIRRVDNHIEFKLLDPSHPEYNHKVFRTDNFREKEIKSSNGVSEIRFLVQTIILLFEQEYPIELSLSERGSMKYPVLLGRKFLNKKFIVDSSKKNISFKLLP